MDERNSECLRDVIRQFFPSRLPSMPPTEIELKLLLPGLSAANIEARLRKVTVLARRRASVQWLRNIYYDTPDQLLKQKRHALRMRQITSIRPSLHPSAKVPKGDWVQTFKSAGRSNGGLSQRGEWESREGTGQLNLAALKGTPWSEVDPDGDLFESLRPCFETMSQRTIWQLRNFQGAHIEVALDVGEIKAGKLTAPILELELELKGGPPQALFFLAETISNEVGVLPYDVSKAERGYQLAAGKDNLPHTATAIRLKRRTSPQEAAAMALSEIHEHFTRNLALLGCEDDPEVVHQARIAWRRWKSALKLFEPWLEQPPDSSALRPLLTELGRMRDIDVLRGETLPTWLPLFVANDPNRQKIADQALAHFDKAAAKQREIVRSALSLPSTGGALIAIAKDLFALNNGTIDCGPMQRASPKPKEHKTKGRHNAGDGESWAQNRIDVFQKRLDRASRNRGLPGAGIVELHRVRIRAKQLRYSSEILSDLLPKKNFKRLTKRAASLQKAIGDDRDLHQAIRLLHVTKQDETLIAFLRGLIVGQSEKSKNG